MIIFLVILIFSCMTLGCGVDYRKLAINSISEMQESIFVGQSQGVTASLMVGYREKEYIKDGQSGEKIPFAILSFGSSSKEKLLADSFVLFSDGNEYSGALLCNPFTGELQADIGEIDLGEVMVASITSNGKDISIALLPLSDDFAYSSMDALNVVLDGFKDEIKKDCVVGGKFCGEVYLKYCGALSRDASDKYWGVTIITKELSRLNFVVSAENGKIVAH